MKVLCKSGILVFLLLTAGAQESKDASPRYFGQTPPGDTPTLFAPGTISKEDRFEQLLAFSPEGNELTLGLTNSDWSEFSLVHMSMKDGHWTEPIMAPFLGSDASGLTACLSYDLGTAFFTAARPSYPPSDIWMNQRSEAGWSEPTKVGPPISSGADEFEVAISRNGTLYFSSARAGGHGDLDIYRARLVDGAYPTAENLGPPINTSAGDDLPCIAPDGNYLIFASDRPGGLGNRDLYISFQIDGAWTQPLNLGSPINTESFDIYPSLSPDGKYLFFGRRDGWLTDNDSDIYWVSTDFIDRLRETKRLK